MRRVVSRLSLSVAAATLALTAAGCAGGSPSPGSTGAEGDGPIKVTVGAVFTTAAVPLWIAEDQGIFAKHGLEVEITQAPNFASSAPALLSGQMQFANAATAPMITAVDSDMPLQIVAGVQAESDDPMNPDDGIVVPAGSDITRPADLAGKTIATNAVGSGPYVGVMATVAKDGGNPSDIEWVVMNLNEQIPALENGSIDAGMVSEPFLVMAERAGFSLAFNIYRVPGVEMVPAGFTDAVLVASNEYVAGNPDVVKRMYDAMIDANDYAEANPDVVRDLMVERLELDPEMASDINLPAFVGQVDPEGIQIMVDAMFDLELIDEKLDASTFVWQE